MDPVLSSLLMRMRAVVVAAVFVALGAFSLPARAADHRLVAAFDKTLTPLERAILASILTNPANDAEFDGDMREAQKDAPSLALAQAKWRMRMAEFSQGDRTAPDPNLQGTYRTYPEMLTPPIRAYLARRLRDLQVRGQAGDPKAQEAYEGLRDYLKTVQDSLDNNNGTLAWYPRQIVSGIMAKYREELTEFLGTEAARKALRDGPAAVAELKRRRDAAAEAIQQAARAEEERRRRQTVAGSTSTVSGSTATVVGSTATVVPSLPVPGVIETDAQRTARLQLEAAERAARAGKPGLVFDGGVVPGDEVPPVSAGADMGRRAGLVVPDSSMPNITGPRVEPPSMTDEDVLLASIQGPRGSGKKSWKERTPHVGGALVGAVIGFLLGGPIGAAIGAVIGLGLGMVGANMLFK